MQCSDNYIWTSEEGGIVQATAEFTVTYRVRHEYGPGLNGKWTVIDAALGDMLKVKIWAGCVGDDVPVCGDFAQGLEQHIRDKFDESDVEPLCVTDYEKALSYAD